MDPADRLPEERRDRRDVQFGAELLFLSRGDCIRNIELLDQRVVDLVDGVPGKHGMRAAGQVGGTGIAGTGGAAGADLKGNTGSIYAPLIRLTLVIALTTMELTGGKHTGINATAGEKPVGGAGGEVFTLAILRLTTSFDTVGS